MNSSSPETSPQVLVKFSGLASGGLVSGSILEGEQTGKRVFASGAVPGEEALVEITNDQGRFAEGVVSVVRSTSADRIVPPCPLFPECGGCDYQHIDSGAQRRLKVAMVRDMLHHHGKIEPHRGIYMLGEALPAFYYRRRATFHLDLKGDLGFYKRGTTEVVDCPRCLVVEEPLNETLTAIRPFTRKLAGCCSGISLEKSEEPSVKKSLEGKKSDSPVWIVLKLREGFRRVTLVEAAQDLIDSGLPVVLSESERVFQAFRDGTEIQPSVFENAIGRFSQGNKSGNDLLVQHVVAQFQNIPEITEFYAGGGNFTFPLAASGAVVRAVEVDGDLAASGEQLAHERGLERQVQFHHQSTEFFLKLNKIRGAVLLDPPRSGAKALAEALSPTQVSLIVYVSCNLPTLTRDLQVLRKRGFAVQEVAVIDLFPQTHHVETVTVLKPSIEAVARR